jgi:hypothetical protein
LEEGAVIVMADEQGPWQKYQSVSQGAQTGERGPWENYQVPSSSSPATGGTGNSVLDLVSKYVADRLNSVPGQYIGDRVQDIKEGATRALQQDRSGKGKGATKTPSWSELADQYLSSMDDRLGGASQAGRGIAGSIGLPFLGLGFAAAPLTTLAGLTVAPVAQQVTENVLPLFGAGPGTSQFIGDIAGVGAGYKAGGAIANKLTGFADPFLSRGRQLWNAAKANPAGALEALAEDIPFVRKVQKFEKKLEPSPVKSEPFTPFTPSAATARRMPYQRSSPSSGMPSGGGPSSPRTPAFGPDVLLTPQAAPEASPTMPGGKFTINPAVAKKMAFEPGSELSGMPRTGSSSPRRTPAFGPEVSLRPTPEAPTRTIPGGKFEVKSSLKSRLSKAGGAGSESGMPTSTGSRNIKRKGFTPKPTLTSPEEGGVPPEGLVEMTLSNGVKTWVTPAMREAMAKGVVAEKAGAVKPSPGAEYLEQQAKIKNAAIRDYVIGKEPTMTKAKWRGLADQEKIDYITKAGFKKPAKPGHPISRDLPTVSKDIETLLPD